MHLVLQMPFQIKSKLVKTQLLVQLLIMIVLTVVVNTIVALNAVNAVLILDLFLWRQVVNKFQLTIADKVQKVFPYQVKAVKAKKLKLQI